MIIYLVFVIWAPIIHFHYTTTLPLPTHYTIIANAVDSAVVTNAAAVAAAIAASLISHFKSSFYVALLSFRGEQQLQQ